ncbi:hypothetical protein TNCV_2020911 [Trichonephila clavipes]|nr:hypothetical protein TNCV_2020911 [Trichonephila clavipes]
MIVLSVLSNCPAVYNNAVLKDLGLNLREGMDVCKCVVPMRHEGTLNSHRAASPLVRLVEGSLSPLPQGCSPTKLGWNRAEKNDTVTCMVLKATVTDRRTSSSLP